MCSYLLTNASCVCSLAERKLIAEDFSRFAKHRFEEKEIKCISIISYHKRGFLYIIKIANFAGIWFQVFFWLFTFLHLLITDILWSVPKHLKNIMENIQKPFATNRLCGVERKMEEIQEHVTNSHERSTYSMTRSQKTMQRSVLPTETTERHHEDFGSGRDGLFLVHVQCQDSVWNTWVTCWQLFSAQWAETDGVTALRAAQGALRPTARALHSPAPASESNFCLLTVTP